MTTVSAVPALPSARSALRVEVVDSLAGLVALEPEWNALLERSDVRHPFLSHEWVRTWWECFGSGWQLRVLVVRDAGEAVAIAPLRVGRRRLMGVSMRCLESMANDHTPRFDFIVAAGVEHAWDALWEALLSRRDEWDLLRLCQLPEDSATRTRIGRRGKTDGFLVGEWAGDESPFLPLTGSWDAYCRQGRRKHFANLRNRNKRLARLGAVEHEVVADQGEALWEGFRIEAMAWKAEAGTALVSRPETQQFYTRFAERAADRGWLRLAFLDVGGRRIAFAYCLDYQGRRFVVKIGYDPGWSTYSPFHLLCQRELEDAFRRKLAEFDLLGCREPWKQEWTGDARRQFWLFLLAPRPCFRLLHGVKFGWLPRLQQHPSYRALRDFVARRDRRH